MARKKLKVVDLFSGCGGLSLGFENAGYDVVLGIDNWKPVVDVYKENFNHDFLDIDLLNSSDASKIIKGYKPDIIIGGPPCQDFSQAGWRNESGGRANLTVSFAEIVSKVKPDIFIMENVDQLTKSQSFKRAFELLKKVGYGISIKLLDASYCGVPQSRKRFFVIGHHKKDDDLLLEYLEKNLSQEPMTMRDYFGKTLKTEYYYRHPWSYKRRAVYGLDEPSPTVRGVNRPIPAGYPGHHLDATNDLSKARPLTTTERGQIQTFPSDFKWVGTKTNLEQIIGNAVPVKLGEYVAYALKEYLKDEAKGKLKKPTQKSLL